MVNTCVYQMFLLSLYYNNKQLKRTNYESKRIVCNIL